MVDRKKVLVIEDELNIARFIELELNHEGYKVTVVHDGREGLDKALQEEWDLILLDLMLPGLNGMEICRRIRSNKKTPIIILTARDNVMDLVSGLDSGADDYISKPFAIEELFARIRSLFRRLGTENRHEQAVLLYKHLIIDMDARIIKRNDEAVELTKREYELLLVFLKNINRVLTREILLEQVWGYVTQVETNVVDVYVRYLRHKLDLPEEESIIQTVRGTGYVMRQ
ncbi:response regulator transcription factor [Brevibacillus choshinensis]|uniref:Response regulator transcription factor n=1 Tax=Brevibacillus choshinensis TaxID=54911 RepID=A0ABX7FIK9_BRECH|nr:response regulator transcription factor [Brevibacillus choshinensis]QRG65574.1 response regulator transcription factor [Brevibacillus choshinensis]